MAKPKRLEINDNVELSIKNLMNDALSLFGDCKDAGGKPVLKAVFDASHSGRVTNNRVYPGRFMKSGVDSFMQPNPKPVLKHHKDEQDPVGKITSAGYIQTLQDQLWLYDYKNPTDSGSGYIKLGVSILDPDTIEKVIDGRLSNVSTRQGTKNAFCSVCGEDFMRPDECEHQPGSHYETENGDSVLCYAITGPLEYREVSFVSLPGDAHAKVTNFSLDSLASSFISTKASVDSLVLADGENEVDLLSSLGKNRITVKDKEKLTGKIVVAVGPKFDPRILDSINTEGTNMTEVKQNTDVATASGGKGALDKEDSKKTQKEGVVAPNELSKNITVEAIATLSDAANVTALEAITESLRTAKAEAVDAKAKNERLEAALKDKEEEITKLRQGNAQIMADMKHVYANQLLMTQLFLKKPVTATVTDKESFDKKLTEYAGRSVDSLKDSINDLDTELLALKDTLGVKTTATVLADKKIESPVANAKPKVEPVTKDSEEVASTKEAALNTLFGS